MYIQRSKIYDVYHTWTTQVLLFFETKYIIYNIGFKQILLKKFTKNFEFKVIELTKYANELS